MVLGEQHHQTRRAARRCPLLVVTTGLYTGWPSSVREPQDVCVHVSYVERCLVPPYDHGFKVVASGWRSRGLLPPVKDLGGTDVPTITRGRLTSTYANPSITPDAYALGRDRHAHTNLFGRGRPFRQQPRICQFVSCCLRRRHYVPLFQVSASSQYKSGRGSQMESAVFGARTRLVFDNRETSSRDPRAVTCHDTDAWRAWRTGDGRG